MSKRIGVAITNRTLKSKDRHSVHQYFIARLVVGLESDHPQTGPDVCRTGLPLVN
jgi:hypothetical protein